MRIGVATEEAKDIVCATRPRVHMKLPTFDIFSGHYGEKDAVWIEAVEGLGNADERMRALAAEKPGPYFVFHTWTHRILSSADTSAGNPKAKSDKESDVA